MPSSSWFCWVLCCVVCFAPGAFCVAAGLLGAVLLAGVLWVAHPVMKRAAKKAVVKACLFNGFSSYLFSEPAIIARLAPKIATITLMWQIVDGAVFHANVVSCEFLYIGLGFFGVGYPRSVKLKGAFGHAFISITTDEDPAIASV